MYFICMHMYMYTVLYVVTHILELLVIIMFALSGIN